jgi:hypothetical protein
MALGVLAIGYFWPLIVAAFVFGGLVLAGIAFWKMRSDDFWEKQEER